MTRNEQISQALMLVAFWPIFEKAAEAAMNRPWGDYHEDLRQEDAWLDDLESYRMELDAALGIYDDEEANRAYEILRCLEGNHHGTKASLDQALIDYAWYKIFENEAFDWEDEADCVDPAEYKAQCDAEDQMDDELLAMRRRICNYFHVCDHEIILDAFGLLEGVST